MGNGRLGSIPDAGRGIKETTPGRAESTQTNYITKKERVKAMVTKATKDRPTTRRDLRYATGFTDRANRRIIETLRKEGLRICSTAHGKGYWVARTEHEYKAFRTEYLSGAFKRLETVKQMDNATEGQVEMEG